MKLILFSNFGFGARMTGSLIVQVQNLGLIKFSPTPYAFSLWSMRPFWLGFGMLGTTLHTNPYSFLNLPNASTKILQFFTLLFHILSFFFNHEKVPTSTSMRVHKRLQKNYMHFQANEHFLRIYQYVYASISNFLDTGCMFGARKHVKSEFRLLFSVDSEYLLLETRAPCIQAQIKRMAT